MKIIEPNVELWEQGDNNIAHITRCARVCYKRESGNDEVLYNNLIKNKHWSMFRHESVYAIVPRKNIGKAFRRLLHIYIYCPYIQWNEDNDNLYIATNGNFLLDLKSRKSVFYNIIDKYKVTCNEFKNVNPIYTKELLRYTFKVTTQISTSRELNRVSPNNIAEQSTRYVYEDGTICRPHWMDYNLANNLLNNINKESDYKDYDINTINKTHLYIKSCIDSFNTYKTLIDTYGMNRQDARGALPIDTATVCAYTYSIREWRNILDLRYYGTAGKPHPNAKIITGMIRDKLIELGYEFR